jgi:hypothetical protein
MEDSAPKDRENLPRNVRITSRNMRFKAILKSQKIVSLYFGISRKWILGGGGGGGGVLGWKPTTN